MFFKSILSLLCIAQAVYSSPITARDSTGTVSCDNSYHYGALSLTQAPYGGLSWPVTFGTTSSGGGEENVQVAVTNDAQQVDIYYQQCNSTYLGFQDGQNNYPGYIKIFNSHNSSQCLQRVPVRNNQILMTDCSNVDDINQQDQFWNYYQPYGLVYPVSVTEKRETSLAISLSGGTNGNLMATLQNDQGLKYDEQYYPGLNPIKIYNSHNISQCLQRVPSRNNQIIMTECSDVDDTDQQNQFWGQYLPYGFVVPISVTDEQESDLSIVLSGGTSGDLLAAPGNDDHSVLALKVY
ncbi:uncharacterized protein FA14DRAFT_191809 [Meira miltonrushii]|uniref:Uncharacterized protein n=1 Tax=Meira miltonrushii TaxID=1280837 RepID=A0A316V655_9BASI|nr:uncharacterized protein FA14DRAFT_191809 [Meira miltonrushii]PWN32734.1 hypothetical protein FA14DRAFT_191809 [Meira miltonrushii]